MPILVVSICYMGYRGFDEENDTMTEYVQTRWYRAPELLCESPHYGRVSVIITHVHSIINLFANTTNIVHQ